MSVRNVVVGIVYKKDESEIRFLVLHRILLWKGWEFPKGGIEKGEIEETAIKRELKEEAGLEKIRIIEKLPMQIKYKYPKEYAEKFKDSETVQSVYVVRAFQDDIKLPAYHGVAEHDEFKWLQYEDARKLLTHAQQKKALDAAWKFLNRKEN